jgi:hypothetical protein
MVVLRAAASVPLVAGFDAFDGVLVVAGIGALLVIYRSAGGPKTFAGFMLALAPGPLLMVLAGNLVLSPFVSQLLGGLGLTWIGVHWLVFREGWIRFNQVWSGALFKWHREYANSRLMILSVGCATSFVGLILAVSAVTKL